MADRPESVSSEHVFLHGSIILSITRAYVMAKYKQFGSG
jgi:hypothetical protein